MIIRYHPIAHICPQCKVDFYPEVPNIWAYKRSIKGNDALFCSWRCLRAYEEKHPPKKTGWY